MQSSRAQYGHILTVCVLPSLSGPSVLAVRRCCRRDSPRGLTAACGAPARPPPLPTPFFSVTLGPGELISGTSFSMITSSEPGFSCLSWMASCTSWERSAVLFPQLVPVEAQKAVQMASWPRTCLLKLRMIPTPRPATDTSQVLARDRC